MSLVPYRGARRRRARRPLDREQIVRAAMGLLDEVGLDGLTMRNLAERLAVKATALYRHLRDKDELLVLLADEISGEIAPIGQDPPWQERLAEMAGRARRGLLAHRDAVRLLAAVAPAGPRRMRHIEAMLQLLLAAGFPPRDAVRAAYHFNNFVTEFAADEARLAGLAGAAGSTPAEILAEGRRYLRALPADEYPSLVRDADLLAEDDLDGRFRFGLEAWIAGLERLVRRGTAGTHRRGRRTRAACAAATARRRRTRRSRSTAIGGDRERRVCRRLERRRTRRDRCARCCAARVSAPRKEIRAMSPPTASSAYAGRLVPGAPAPGPAPEGRRQRQAAAGCAARPPQQAPHHHQHDAPADHGEAGRLPAPPPRAGRGRPGRAPTRSRRRFPRRRPRGSRTGSGRTP